ncbi:MAG TPA: CHAP domain-containing protein [Anaeromyxobacter sp.]|nr:CHAP domain-containing protein [Anaeromyxobacter sp.]
MRRVLGPAFVSALLGCATVAPTREAPVGQPAPQAAPGSDAFSEQDLPDAEAPPPQAEPAPVEGGPARPRLVRFDDELAVFDFEARLAARARAYLGRRGPFRSKGQRFGSDCSGFVEAVYAAEGLLLRDLMQRDAPEERGGVKAAWYAARAHGRVFRPPEWPAPGDLVFFSDTYDRNRNGRADDRFTHLAIVEYVEDGTIHFLHRGARGVARGVVTPERPDEASDGDRPLNSVIRARTHPVKDGGLAGQLLEGFGRIDPASVPVEYVDGRIDPFFGPAADREAAAATARAAVPASPAARSSSSTSTAPPTSSRTATSTKAAAAKSAARPKASGSAPSKKNVPGSTGKKKLAKKPPGRAKATAARAAAPRPAKSVAAAADRASAQ